MASLRRVTWQPVTWLGFSLKLEMALRVREKTGFCPAMSAKSRPASAIWFLSASASKPVLRLIFDQPRHLVLVLVAAGFHERRNDVLVVELLEGGSGAHGRCGRIWDRAAG